MKTYLILAAVLGIIPTVVHSEVCQNKPPAGECPNACIQNFKEINQLLTNQLTIPGWEVKWQGGGAGHPGGQTASKKTIPYEPSFSTNDSHLKLQQPGAPNDQGECVYTIQFWTNPWSATPGAVTTVGEFSLVQTKAPTKR
ncbi:MAG: hypothetical protein K2P93_08235 [Alphaproteobacteria bacterium]|nr:hypothetical protein [Alphaproteobacteria bacterium]